MQSLSLNGTWKISGQHRNYHSNIEVPGTLMSLLDSQGEFGKEGIHWRKNNRKAMDWARGDYLFEREFLVDTELLQNQEILLLCSGLDTLTEISLNGSLLGKTENMHRSYEFPIKKLLKQGINHISILFKDSLDYIKQSQDQRFLTHSYYGLPQIAVDGFNRIRKSHCSYGWDWGAIVPDLGIWRDISILAYDHIRLEHLQVRQSHSSEGVEICGTPRFSESGNRDVSIHGRLISPTGEAMSKVVHPGEELKYTLENPQLWWPNGLGDQPLYKLEVEVKKGDEVLQKMKKKLGLRSLTVDRSKDEWGESFHFVCNGQDFFSMGADYIPEDLFVTRMNKERTRKLLSQAKESNFNSLRVWGGAFYPDDYFYELCDEMGLVIWQDLMFACALYDFRNPQFRENIRIEVEQNLDRIHHHASIGLICGNNEMEWGLMEWQEILIDLDDEMRQEYLEQYESFFPKISAEHAPNTFYWPASPSSGGGFDDPNDPNRGDCHYWQVWHGYQPYEALTEHYFRFMSEFGFESLPHEKTIEDFTLPEDRSLFSEVMEDHQRGSEGNRKLYYYLRRYFKRSRDFSSMIYLSQISQAEAIRHGVQHWRRNRGRCMGALYWQFNDNWPVSSWSSIDYNLRWKALQYQVKRDFAPLMLSIKKTDNGAEIHLGNESNDSLSGQLVWRWLNCQGDTLGEGHSPVNADPFSSKPAIEIELTEELLAEKEKGNLILDAYYKDNSGKYCQSMEALSSFKEMQLQEPQFDVKIFDDQDCRKIKISSDRPAFYIEIQTDDPSPLQDNFFHLAPGNEVIVNVQQTQLKDLRLRSLWSAMIPD